MDLMHSPHLWNIRLGVRNTALPGNGWIRDVYDDGIKIMTEEDAFFTTVLDPQRDPYLVDSGLTDRCTRRPWLDNRLLAPPVRLTDRTPAPAGGTERLSKSSAMEIEVGKMRLRGAPTGRIIEE